MNPNDQTPDALSQQSEPVSTVPKPAPVMDVVAPRAEPAAETAAPLATPPEESGDVEPAPESPDELIEQESSINEAPPAATVKAPKQPGSGIGLAVFGTIVIVLALSALATYAYLQSK